MQTSLANELTSAGAGRSWRIDPSRSSVAFEVRHFHLATVSGRFTDFEGLIGGWGARGTVDVASVETGNEIRDARLRSEFFDAAAFPKLTFETSEPLAPTISGLLTIRDVARPITVEVSSAEDDHGALHVTARTTISRKAFGLDWAALREAGRLIVSDKIRIRLDLVTLPE